MEDLYRLQQQAIALIRNDALLATASLMSKNGPVPPAGFRPRVVTNVSTVLVRALFPCLSFVGDHCRVEVIMSIDGTRIERWSVDTNRGRVFHIEGDVRVIPTALILDVKATPPQIIASLPALVAGCGHLDSLVRDLVNPNRLGWSSSSWST